MSMNKNRKLIFVQMAQHRFSFALMFLEAHWVNLPTDWLLNFKNTKGYELRDLLMSDKVKNTQRHVMIVCTATREALATFTLSFLKESFIWTASESQLKANTLLHTHHFTFLEQHGPLQKKKGKFRGSEGAAH